MGSLAQAASTKRVYKIKIIRFNLYYKCGLSKNIVSLRQKQKLRKASR